MYLDTHLVKPIRADTELRHPPPPLDSAPLWRQIAARKQFERSCRFKKLSQEFFSKDTPDLPDPTETHVRHWPLKCRDLGPKTIRITESSPTHILTSIATGQWTAVEVVRAFAERAVVAQHLTNPITDIFLDQALERASILDGNFQRTGKTVGPLHGLPISIKDVMNLRGHPTTIGYVGLADAVPDDSDDLLSRLEQAGAILYCKTNVPQGLLSGECANYLYGRTTSPDNRHLSAGGSSGGEASLIALGGSPLGIGTDIAGSIRTPANFNGIYGLCPSYGRLPIHSARYAKPSYINAVAGPMCRTIDGLEVYTKAILSMEPWTWDAACVPIPWNSTVSQEIGERATSTGLSFGMIWNDGLVRPHPPIERGLHETKAALEAAGHQVLDITFFTGQEDMERTIMAVIGCDGGVGPNAILNQLPEPAHPETVFPEPSDALSSVELMADGKRLLLLRKHFLDKWMATASQTTSGKPVDVLILPSGGHVAPPHGTMDYYLYEAISNVLDWTCATIPVGTVDARLDPKPGPDFGFTPMSDMDQKNWEKCELNERQSPRM